MVNTELDNIIYDINKFIDVNINKSREILQFNSKPNDQQKFVAFKLIAYDNILKNEYLTNKQKVYSLKKMIKKNVHSTCKSQLKEDYKNYCHKKSLTNIIQKDCKLEIALLKNFWFVLDYRY